MLNQEEYPRKAHNLFATSATLDSAPNLIAIQVGRPLKVA